MRPEIKELQALFMTEAEKYHVLPIDDRLLERTNAQLVGRPTVMEGRDTVTYGPGMKGMGVDIFIATPGKSYTMTADVDVQAGPSGVIVAQGGRFGGFSFYLKGGKPSFTYNYLGLEKFDVVSSQALSPGKHTIVYEFKSDGGPGAGGTGTITIDGTKAGEGKIGKTQPGIFSVDDLGRRWYRRRNAGYGLRRLVAFERRYPQQGDYQDQQVGASIRLNANG
jgi:arylsulfatase